MFAVIALDRDPPKLEDLPAGLLQWLQSAGGFATIGLVLFLLVGLPRWRAEDRKSVPGWMSALFLIATCVSVVAYAAAFLGMLAGAGVDAPPGVFVLDLPNILLTVAGGAAVLAVGLPFLLNLARVRFRRVYALAKLSFKEAIRRRVLYVFSFFLLLFLFGSWFVTSIPKDQVRTYVGITFLAERLLLLFAAALLASFSIPADIKQQTIHTIVTKPVERFEIVLGRFLGFLSLMTLVLVVMTGLGLLYILREIHPEASAESLKARVAHYGTLRFENTDKENEATNVGREWEYRSYITRPNPGQEPQTARWDFLVVPPELATRPEVRCEYGFDVYRTTKGEEGRDVYCTFRFFTWRYRKGNEELFRKEREEGRKLGEKELDLSNKLAEKYGYFEINSQPVTDYRTQFFTLPGGLFKNALEADPERESELKVLGEAKVPLRCRVTCDSYTQYVGMAKYDFYMRVDDPTGSEKARFAANYFKGAFGIWLQLALVIGLAVVISTYLNGPTTFLVVSVLIVGGFGRGFVDEVALGKNQGGGPLEAMVRITRRELSGASFADSASVGDQIVSRSDDAFRWTIRRVRDIVPDIDRYDLSAYVAEGFNIPGSVMGLEFLHLVGYLLPWFVLAFYLMRWREIAGAT
ncbi:MAG: hypothetical protein U0797_14300 [Gemmataceae bacterium]